MRSLCDRAVPPGDTGADYTIWSSLVVVQERTTKDYVRMPRRELYLTSRES